MIQEKRQMRGEDRNHTGRGKNSLTKALIYKNYLETIPLVERIQRTEYNEIYKMYCDFVFDKVINEGYTVFLPANLGKINIVGREVKPRMITDRFSNLCPNWGKTRKLWEERPELKGETFVYYFNEHTGGFRYKFIFVFFTHNLVANLYNAAPMRARRQELGNKLLTGKYTFHTIDYEEVKRKHNIKQALKGNLKPTH